MSLVYWIKKAHLSQIIWSMRIGYLLCINMYSRFLFVYSWWFYKTDYLNGSVTNPFDWSVYLKNRGGQWTLTAFEVISLRSIYCCEQSINQSINHWICMRRHQFIFSCDNDRAYRGADEQRHLFRLWSTWKWIEADPYSCCGLVDAVITTTSNQSLGEPRSPPSPGDAYVCTPAYWVPLQGLFIPER